MLFGIRASPCDGYLPVREVMLIVLWSGRAREETSLPPPLLFPRRPPGKDMLSWIGWETSGKHGTSGHANASERRCTDKRVHEDLPGASCLGNVPWPNKLGGSMFTCIVAEWEKKTLSSPRACLTEPRKERYPDKVKITQRIRSGLLLSLMPWEVNVQP